ncbi:MAG: hypothetical protein K2X27_00465 [Candidatus Obscuribacterales bacterium]|nr:hypothetical protein [Candidatus Obscuribacterales bacterium]
MSEPKWHPMSSRKIVTRIVVKTELVLLSPAHFGNGDSENATDMPLLKDERDDKSPLIPGSSICGALRSYLKSLENGHQSKRGEPSSLVESLFGSDKHSSEKQQSRVIVTDTIGKYRGHEQRQGVRLRPESRTAEDDALYSYRLWATNTIFPLRIELVISEDNDRDQLLNGFVHALAGLSNGGISLGAKKTRGFGRVSTGPWRIAEYDMRKQSDLLAWITGQESGGRTTSLDNILDYSKSQAGLTDRREELEIKADFALDSSILIRSRSGLSASDPDVVHIHRPLADGAGEIAVIPGTSWAGALRTRASRIMELAAGKTRGSSAVDSLFGSSPEIRTNQKASRIRIDESIIENCREDLVQNRVAIDPFTGGARDGALFDEKPVFATPDGRVPLRLKIINPVNTDIGLSLLLLKDLWTGDIPIGGESSVGRGRFHGLRAEIILKQQSGTKNWIITEDSGKLEITGGDRQQLESYVSSLRSNAEILK